MIMSRNIEISISHPPRKIQTWEYIIIELHDLTVFYETSMVGFGAFPESRGFIPPQPG